jgi:[ribosomal protein S5]-alanine N-acetyltransferase
VNIIAKTPRLVIREMTPEDAERVFDLNSDPEVIRYTGDPPFKSVDEARSFLESYDHYRLYGFGRWAVELKDDGAFIGWCGLKYSPEIDENDLGYRLMKRYWGQGFATEAARACLDLGFSRFSMQVIVGRTMPENIGSNRILEKLGMVYQRNSLCEGHNALIYTISAEEWRMFNS